MQTVSMLSLLAVYVAVICFDGVLKVAAIDSVVLTTTQTTSTPRTTTYKTPTTQTTSTPRTTTYKTPTTPSTPTTPPTTQTTSTPRTTTYKTITTPSTPTTPPTTRTTTTTPPTKRGADAECCECDAICKANVVNDAICYDCECEQYCDDEPAPAINDLWKSCGDFAQFERNRHSTGLYVIDPNGGSGFDAITVHCEFRADRNLTCIQPNYIILQNTSHRNVAVDEQKRSWYDSSHFLAKQYQTIQNQLRSLHLTANGARQKLVYSLACDSSMRAIVFKGWNNEIIHADPDKKHTYTVTHNGHPCTSDWSNRGRTEIFIDTNTPSLLPIKDIGFYGTDGIESLAFIFESVCFY